MKTTRKQNILAAALACALAFTSIQAGAQTEPLGGQPPIGSKPSVPNLDEQIAYQRAFEAVVWAMPASAIYRFRVGVLGLTGVTDNTLISASFPTCGIARSCWNFPPRLIKQAYTGRSLTLGS